MMRLSLIRPYRSGQARYRCLNLGHVTGDDASEFPWVACFDNINLSPNPQQQFPYIESFVCSYCLSTAARSFNRCPFPRQPSPSLIHRSTCVQCKLQYDV